MSMNEQQFEMKMIGSDETPRGHLCARLLRDLLIQLVEATGKPPKAAYFAFQWDDGTKVFIAAENAQAAGDIQAGVVQEIQAAYDLGAAHLAAQGAPEGEKSS
jgi:hypothetical protein